LSVEKQHFKEKKTFPPSKPSLWSFGVLCITLVLQLMPRSAMLCHLTCYAGDEVHSV